MIPVAIRMVVVLFLLRFFRHNSYSTILTLYCTYCTYLLFSPLPLRKIVIDGQNVACGFGTAKEKFAVKGLKIAIDFFLARGDDVIAIVPQCRVDTHPSNELVADNVELLQQLKREGKVFFSIAGARGADEHFIIRAALQYHDQGEAVVIVSNASFEKIGKSDALDLPCDLVWLCFLTLELPSTHVAAFSLFHRWPAKQSS